MKKIHPLIKYPLFVLLLMSDAELINKMLTASDDFAFLGGAVLSILTIYLTYKFIIQPLINQFKTKNK